MRWTPEVSHATAVKISERRRELQMSHEALARAAGISRSHVTLIESAARYDVAPRGFNLRLSTLYGLADALGVKPSSLLVE